MKNVALALRCGGDAFGLRGDCCGLWFGQELKERVYCIHPESNKMYSCVGYLSCSKPVVVAVEISSSKFTSGGEHDQSAFVGVTGSSTVITGNLQLASQILSLLRRM